MTLAERYRQAYLTAPSMVTVLDWIALVQSIDPNASMSKRDLGVYIEFTDGSVWRLGAADRNAGAMLA